ILTGHRWARRITASFGVILSIAMMCWLALPGNRLYYQVFKHRANYLDLLVDNLPLFILVLVPIILVPFLYRGRIQNWFVFSEKLRSQHKQQATRRSNSVPAKQTADGERRARQ